MPVPPWSIDAPTYTTSARTGYKEILPDEELDRSIFHAAQVCNLITQFTTEPYHNAGLADIMSFLQLGPRSRSTHLSAEGSIFGFGWNVVLPLPTWSLLFQMAIGADACTRLHNLGFDRILRPRVMDFEAECARLAAEMETRGKEEAATTKEHDAAAAKGAETACAQSETQDEMKANSARDDEEVAVLYSNNASVEMDTSAEEETKADKGNQAAAAKCVETKAEDKKEVDKEASTAKRFRNASAAIDIVTKALGSPWVRIDHDVVTQLHTTYQHALDVCASTSNIE